MKQTIKKIAKKTAPRLVNGVTRVERIEKKVDELQHHISTVMGAHDARLDELHAMVKQVEPYQPAYGISGLVDSPRRSSRERCIVIENYLRPIAGKRILDIGSSLGFFSFYFADRDAKVQGWEENVRNAEVARRIGEINGISVDFRTKEFNSETVTSIPYGAFDAVFILSVFHHIIRFNGLEYTQNLIRELMNRIPVLIVELAKKGEDPNLPWDASQPDDELAIFDLIKDEIEIKKLGDFGNHLSKKTRPLYAIQKKKQVSVNAHHYNYERVSTEAYQGSPVAHGDIQRRYFFTQDAIIKEYSFDAKSHAENVTQILNEIKIFLDIQNNKEKIYHVPRMRDFEIDYPTGAKIVVDRLEGELATDIDISKKPKIIAKIIKDVLKSLADLEALHLHHNDIRSWNIIVDNTSGGWLLDFGLTGPKLIDDDIVSLLWAANAMYKHERESYSVNKHELPPRTTFKDTALAGLYEAVKKGERSPAKLLPLLG